MGIGHMHHSVVVEATRCAIALAVGLVIAASASAQTTVTWNNTPNGLWSTGTNWTPNTTLTTGGTYSLFFITSAVTNVATNDVANLTVSAMSFIGRNKVISGNAINLTGTITYNIATAETDLGLNMTLDATRSISVSSGSLALTGTLSGAGGLTKLGAGSLRLSSANQNSGDIDIQNGTVEAAMIANAGVASSLGSASTAIKLGHNATAGILRYTGAATASTNRQIQIGSNTASHSGGSTIENNGAGPLSFSNSAFNVVATATAARTLTLGGTNTGFNEIQGVIRNNVNGATTGPLSLSKASSGRWVLSGVNTYSGSTSVTAGRLQIGPTGSINSTSGITIDGASAELRYNSATTLTKSLTLTQGTISGTGTIGTAVTFASGDFLSPGNSPGEQSYASLLDWDPLGTYQWELNALAGTAGTNWDLVNVTSGTFDLSGLSTGAGGQFVLDLITLDAANAAGPLAIPYNSGSHTFPIASYNPANFLLPTGFANTANADLSSLFSVNLASWQGAKPDAGNISVRINSTATGIDLVIVPEPDTVIFAGVGIAMAGWSLWKRRRHTS